MRSVIQRVASATVTVEGKSVASIGAGIVALVGIFRNDTDDDMDYIIRKILDTRIFDDSAGTMNLSLADIAGEVILVSQFTLYGDARKGKRPSYSDAMSPAEAKDFFDRFLEKFRARYAKVQAGVFGANMDVSLVNSGPVTILIDSGKMF